MSTKEANEGTQSTDSTELANQPTHTNSPESGRNRRSLKGLFIEPRKQVLYSLVFFGGGTFIFMAFVVLYLTSLTQSFSALTQIYQIDADIMVHLHKSLKSATLITIVFGTLLILLTFTTGMMLTHRIFGPVVQISRHIQALNDGNYAARGQLRKNDEFHGLMDSLNDLAATLEKRHGQASEGEPKTRATGV